MELGLDQAELETDPLILIQPDQTTPRIARPARENSGTTAVPQGYGENCQNYWRVFIRSGRLEELEYREDLLKEKKSQGLNARKRNVNFLIYNRAAEFSRSIEATTNVLSILFGDEWVFFTNRESVEDPLACTLRRHPWLYNLHKEVKINEDLPECSS